MQEFIEGHKDQIKGQLYGFDRVIFEGRPQTLRYTDGVEKLLTHSDTGSSSGAGRPCTSTTAGLGW